MKHLLQLLQSHAHLEFTGPLRTLILLGAGRASSYVKLASQLAQTVVLVDADPITCQENTRLLAQNPTWQVLQATVAAEAGHCSYHIFNAARFNGLLPLERLGNRPANLKQTGTTEVVATTLGQLLEQLVVGEPTQGTAVLIDLGDAGLSVLQSLRPGQLIGVSLVGLTLQSALGPQSVQQRVRTARQMGLQMLAMQCDATGHEPCFIYQCDTADVSHATEKSRESAEPPEVAELRLQVKHVTAEYQALTYELEGIKMVHEQLLDQASQENQMLRAEIAELKSRHQKFNEHMVRAESQLDLMKSLLFRDQTI